MFFTHPIILDLPNDKFDMGHPTMGTSGSLVGFNMTHCIWRFGFLEGTRSAEAFGVHSGEKYWWIITDHQGKPQASRQYGFYKDLPQRFKAIVSDDNVFMKVPDKLPGDIR